MNARPANRRLISRAAPVLLALVGLAILFAAVPTTAESSGPGKPPDTPEGLEGTAIFVGGVDLEWTDVPGAESYEVQLFRNVQWIDLPGDGVEIAFYGAGAIISQLNHDGYTYWFQVRANNAKGSSEWSDPYLMQPTYHFEAGRKERPENVVATGAPTISGTAQVGKVLTADASGIEDGNGLDRVKFQYQWVSNDGTTDTDIEGATESAYRLQAADEGKTLKVRGSFIDRHGYAESLTSAATPAALESAANIAPTGAPAISGPTHVSGTLTASVQGIDDQNGLRHAAFRYRWTATDGTIETVVQDSEKPIYVLAEADEGKTVQVDATFTDDDGYEETLLSVPTGAIGPRPNRPATGEPTINGTVQVGETLTADTSGIKDADGINRDRVRFQFKWIANDGVTDTELSYGPGNSGFPNYTTYTLTVDDAGKTIRVQVEFNDGRGHRETVTSAPSPQVSPGPNIPATGVPTISGAPKVGRTLTVDASGISDENGLDPAAFSHQWVVSDGATDTDIAGADDSTYTAIADDTGKTIHVRVTFTDKGGYQESVTSAATVPVFETDDHGDTPETATPLPVDIPNSNPTQGTVYPRDDYDYFRLEVTDENSGYIKVSFYEWEDSDPDPSLFYARLALFNGDGTCVTRLCDLDNGTDAGYLQAYVQPGVYYLRITGPHHDLDTDSVGANRGYYVFWARDQHYYDRLEECRDSSSGFDDPLFGCQGHLKADDDYDEYPGSDINVVPAWEAGHFGAGINVVVVDTGIDDQHQDLVGVVVVGKSGKTEHLPRLYDPRSQHGTKVAGIIAAQHNTVGVRGIAPEATIYSFRLFQDSSFREWSTNPYESRTSQTLGDPLTLHHTDVAVSNNSWGTGLLGYVPGEMDELRTQSLLKGINEGFHGKGTLYVFSAIDEDGNLWELSSHYAVIQVCGVGPDGKKSIHEGHGYNLWMCAPLGGYTTHNNNYYGGAVGTSFSAPHVSGVAALVRSADMELTWRDVKLILAGSAVKNDPDHAGWEAGALKYGSTTETYSFNPNYGFGVVDAKAAVDLAATWTNLPPMQTASANSGNTNLAIPDPPNSGTPTTVETSVTLEDDGHSTPLFTEHVEIEVKFDHPSFRDLDVELVSPTGTVSKLASHDNDLRGGVFDFEYSFGSSKHLGENPVGTWTLRITDHVSRYQGQLKEWSVIVRGHRPEAVSGPHIVGTPQVRETLTVDTSGIDDEDGLVNVSFSYQWLANDAGIVGATDPTYTLVDDDAGLTIKVQVSFFDDKNNPDTLTSAATTAVLANVPDEPEHLNVSLRDTGALDVSWEAPASDGGSAITEYRVQWKEIAGNWDAPADVSEETATGTTHTITGLTDGVEYAVRVIVANNVGEGPPSGEATGTPREATAPVLTKATVKSVHLGTQPEAAEANSGDEPVLVGSVTVVVTQDNSDPDNVITSFAVTWRDYKDCASEYNAYFATHLYGVPVIGGGTYLEGFQIHLGSAASADSEIAKSLSNVQDTSPGFGFEVKVYCGTLESESGRGVSFVYVPQGILHRPQPGTHSSEPGLTALTVNPGTLSPEFHNHTVEYTVGDVPNANDMITVTTAVKTGLTVGIIPWDARPIFWLCSPGAGGWRWSCSEPYEDEDTLPDADVDAPGYQLALEEGDNHFAVFVWNADEDARLEFTTYILTVTRAAMTPLQTRSKESSRDTGVLNRDSRYLSLDVGTAEETASPDLTLIVAGTFLTLTYDEALDEDSVPATGAFTVAVSGTAAEVSHVSVSGSAVTLMLASAVTSEDTVTVSYTAPTDAAAPRIQDDAGNAAESFSDQDVENNTPPPANTPATGQPAISGTARVGETLTVDTTAISDADGLDDVTFTYQWLADGTEISGATDPTYTLVAADEDKAIKVRVSFSDDADNQETLTSAATAAVDPDPGPMTGFTVVDASDQSVEGALADGGTLALDDPDGGSFGIRADLESGATIGSMRLQLTGEKTHDQTENITPYSLYGDSGGNLSGESLPVGEYTLTATAYSEARLGGNVLGTLKVSFSVTETATQQPNTPATGAPTISGTAQVGETLTADISGIGDDDGLDNATFSYQWIAGTTDISGATGSSYAPLVADLGKTIKVRVSFMDGASNVETLTSEATAAVTLKPNSRATGLPAISGTAQVGETLTVDTSGIDDADGIGNATFSYQWIAGTTDIAGATDPTYTLVADDGGKAIRVRVSFDDDLNFLETLTSEATATVVTPLTAEFRDAPDKHDGTGAFTFRIAFSEPISISYKTLRDDSLEVTNGSATKAKRVDGQSDLWEITVEPDSNAAVTVVLPITEDCAAQDAVCTRDGTELSNRSELTVPGPAAANSPPTGAPIISGTAQVGETLTVDTSGIDDADGMSGAVFSYQWLANDAEITGATGDTYTLVEADFDKAVKVRVIFNDDDDNEETLTSEPTAAVAAETAAPDAPRSLNVSPDDTGTLDVSWEAPASDGGSAITGYKVQWKSGSEDYDGSAGSTRQAEITDPASRTHTITGLTDGVEYTVRVIAVNDVGDGPPSDEATGTPRETTPPELATATVDGTTLTLTYDEALDEASGLAADAFSVAVVGTGRAVDRVSVAGSSVILTLGSAVASGATVTVSYAAPADTAAPRIQDDAGNPAASFSDQAVVNNTPPPPNTPATGAPTISGTARVGETLTAETSAIADADGLDNVGYSYQWLANGADIAGATDPTYTLVDDDAGKAIQVKVSFRDDKNNPETLTSAATAAVEPRPNTPATGAPTISGTVRVGETLTAGTSAIADADGMSGAVFIYHWLANGADIAGATNNTYTLVDTDVGKTIKARVIFTDNADNEETLTSAATAAVEPRPNSPATGAPTISGTAQVGETLTVDTSDIADADGMSGAVFSYQWLANGADVTGATSDTYTPVADDVGKAIKVKVSFRDDRNHQESLTSAATAAVTAADDSSIWSATLTVGSSGSFHGYWKDFMGSLAPDGFNIDGSDYTVTSLNRYGDLMFAFVLDQALPGDFTLQVGDTTLRSEEAEVTTSSSSYSYQWQNKIPDLSDGDIVEVSLTLAE